MDSTEKLIFGSYEILRSADGSPQVLGQGGFGVTYKARHGTFKDEVYALKVIREDILNRSSKENQEERDRFLSEAKAVRVLKHEGIAAVHDCGADEGVLYYAMDYCDGGTLQDWCQANGPMPWAEVRVIAAQIASALDYAHRKGFLHRDIKPANIMLHGRGGGRQAKLIDFGLAKRIASDSESSSATVRNDAGNFRGNFATASPEQIDERDLDARSDLFSFGITLWWLLAGKNPFAEMKRGALIADRLGSGSYAPLLPSDLEPEAREMLAELLEKDREMRPDSARHVVDRLSSPPDAPPEAGEPEEEAPAPLPMPAGFEEGYTMAGLDRKYSQVAVYHAGTLPDGFPVMALVPGEGLEPRALGGMRIAANRRLSFGVYSFLDWRVSGGADAFVVPPPWGCSLLEVLRKLGPARFSDVLPFLSHLARCFDASLAWTSFAVRVDPGEMFVRSRAGGAELSGFTAWTDLDPEGASCLPLFPSDQEEDHGGTIRTSAEGLPPLPQFAALVYRILAGSAVKYSAYFTPTAYVKSSRLTEDGNDLISEALCDHDGSQPSACRLIQMLAATQSQPLAQLLSLIDPPTDLEIAAGMLPLVAPEPLLVTSEPTTTTTTQDSSVSVIEKVAELERMIAAVKREAEEEARRKAEEEEKRRADEEAKRRADVEAKRRADEEVKRRADVEAKRRADEEAKRRADVEAKRRADEEAKRRADVEAKRRADEEAKRRADEEAKRRADEEVKRRADGKTEPKEQSLPDASTPPEKVSHLPDKGKGRPRGSRAAFSKSAWIAAGGAVAAVILLALFFSSWYPSAKGPGHPSPPGDASPVARNPEPDHPAPPPEKIPPAESLSKEPAKPSAPESKLCKITVKRENPPGDGSGFPCPSQRLKQIGTSKELPPGKLEYEVDSDTQWRFTLLDVNGKDVAFADFRVPAGQETLTITLPAVLPKLVLTNPYEYSDYNTVILKFKPADRQVEAKVDKDKGELRLSNNYFHLADNLKDRDTDKFPTKDKPVTRIFAGAGEWTITYTGSKLGDGEPTTYSYPNPQNSGTSDLRIKCPEPCSGCYSLFAPMPKAALMLNKDGTPDFGKLPPSKPNEQQEVAYFSTLTYNKKFLPSKNAFPKLKSDERLPHYVVLFLEMNFQSDSNETTFEAVIIHPSLIMAWYSGTGSLGELGSDGAVGFTVTNFSKGGFAIYGSSPTIFAAWQAADYKGAEIILKKYFAQEWVMLKQAEIKMGEKAAQEFGTSMKPNIWSIAPIGNPTMTIRVKVEGAGHSPRLYASKLLQNYSESDFVPSEPSESRDANVKNVRAVLLDISLEEEMERKKFQFVDPKTFLNDALKAQTERAK